MKWISVDDEMPAIGQPVILFDGCVQHEMYMLDDGDTSDYYSEHFWISNHKDLTEAHIEIKSGQFWMALPDKPKQAGLVTAVAEGRKDDAGKPRWSLLPYNAVGEVVKVMTFGAAKYDDNNWQKMEDTTRYSDAAMRHFSAWQSGERIDAETGLSHLAHAATNLIFLLWFELTGKLK